MNLNPVATFDLNDQKHPEFEDLFQLLFIWGSYLWIEVINFGSLSQNSYIIEWA